MTALVGLMAVPAFGAELHGDHVGTSCGYGEVGTWHFVNNQTDRATERGIIAANFDGWMYYAFAEKVNRNTQHFYFRDTGNTLLGASTDLPGKLLLSDYSCEPDDPYYPY